MAARIAMIAITTSSSINVKIGRTASRPEPVERATNGSIPLATGSSMSVNAFLILSSMAIII
ncbi:MAG: hypothetical protein A2X48_03355 [Lentisphaerae bacterium GWF2_49_21]|nr:MAG: hypothetical protein A2X48_03355 [Lentisphaerae bacterium GWF2_49_21]